MSEFIAKNSSNVKHGLSRSFSRSLLYARVFNALIELFLHCFVARYEVTPYFDRTVCFALLTFT